MPPRGFDTTEFYKLALTGSATLVISMSGYLFLGLNKVTHDELDAAVQNKSPWIHDKGNVETQITDLREADKRHTVAIKELTEHQRIMEQKIARLEVQCDKQREMIEENKEILKAIQEVLKKKGIDP
jgi:TolA-binding protein